jgi:trehalose 6-phosphate synthase
MNLVAKEYIVAKNGSNGVLILSRFTGAARELSKALFINPYATDEFAQTIKIAVKMPIEEVSLRMKKLREIVKERNIYRRANRILIKVIQLS